MSNVISGKISSAGQLGNPTGQFAVRYQDVAVQTPQGVVSGRVGSKHGYFIGQDVVFEVLEKVDNNQQKYYYFKKVSTYNAAPPASAPVGFNPPPQPMGNINFNAPMPPSIPQNRPPQPNPNDMVIIREVAIKTVLGNVEIPLDMIRDFLLASVQFILTGDWQLKAPIVSFSREETGDAEFENPGDDGIPA